MREIKFRGLTTGEAPTWVYGSLVNNLWSYSEYSKYPKGTPVCEIIVSGECDDYADVEEKELNVTVITESIGQFTGLRDKNGKEVYEGDILEWDDSRSIVRGQISFAGSGFWIEEDDARFLPGTYTVVGNIHENSELLQKTKPHKLSVVD